jgi:hypothetical protein
MALKNQLGVIIQHQRTACYIFSTGGQKTYAKTVEDPHASPIQNLSFAWLFRNRIQMRVASKQIKKCKRCMHKLFPSYVRPVPESVILDHACVFLQRVVGYS